LLLGLAAAMPTCIALAAELVFVCSGVKGLFLRPGAVGLRVRRAQRAVDRQIPYLSAVAAVAAVGLALAAGPMTRAGCLALGALLALIAHLTFCSRVARRFEDDATCLDRSSATSVDLEALQARWEVEMTTRASLHSAALVCIFASMMLR
jgi:hypothetical protein